MQLIKSINQIVAFLLELGMLAAVGLWGYLQGRSLWSKYAIAILLILVAASLWGYFAAPRSAHRLSLGYLVIFKFLLFTITTLMLYNAELRNYAIVFGVLALLSLGLEYYFEE